MGFYEAALKSRRRIILITAGLIAAYMIVVYQIMLEIEPFNPGTVTSFFGREYAPQILFISAVLIASVLALLGAAGIQFSISVTLIFGSFFLAALTLCGTYLLLLKVANDPGRAFLIQGIIQVLVVVHVFSVLPFRALLLLSLIVCISTAIATGQTDGWSEADADFYLQQLVSINVVLLAAAKMLEIKARQNWSLHGSIAEARVRREEEHRRDTEWLSFTAHFLRHELRNALTGISTSLVLIKRRAESSTQLELAQSAEDSVVRMRKLLDRAGDATSTEAELSEQSEGLTDLESELQRAIETEFGETPGEWRLRTRGEAFAVNAPQVAVRVGLEHCIRYLARANGPPKELAVSLESGDEVVSLTFSYTDPNRAAGFTDPRFGTQSPDCSPHFDLFVAKRAFETATGSLSPIESDDGSVKGIEILLPSSGAPLLRSGY